jgi:thioredoxin-like negative regulator of GroEL
MARADLARAGEALARGEGAKGASLLSEALIADADGPATADHLWLARAVALVRADQPGEAASTLARLSPARRSSTGAQRVQAAIHAARGGSSTGGTAPASLLQKKQDDVKPLLTAVRARQGLAALPGRNLARGAERLRLATSEGIADETLRRQVMLGLLASSVPSPRGPTRRRSWPRAVARIVAGGPRPPRAGATSRLDLPAAVHGLRLLGTGPAVEPLWWALISRLAEAARSADLASLLPAVPAASFSPRVSRAIACLGVAALRQLGRRDEASALLGKALAAAPEDPELVLLAASLAMEEGDLERADGLLATFPEEHPPARLHRLSLAFAQGRYGVVRAALPPEALRAIPDAAERSAAATLSAYASIAFGATARGRLVLKAAPAPPTALQRFLAGYAALAEGLWPEATAALVGTRLLPLARLEQARHLADSGKPLDGLRELDFAAQDPSLSAEVAETRRHLWLRTCQQALLRKDLPLAARTLADTRRAAPDLASRVAVLEDQLRFAAGWSEAAGGGVSGRIAFLDGFSRSAPPALPGQSRARRTAEVSYLVAVARLEEWRRTGQPAEGLARVRRLLDEALAADAELAPAAALLGVILAGRLGSGLRLLDVAQRHGLASPAIRRLSARATSRRATPEARGSSSPRRRTGGQGRIFRLLRDLLRESPGPSSPNPDPQLALEIPDLLEGADGPDGEPFGGVDPLKRLPVLAARVQRARAGATSALEEKLSAVASSLARIAAAADPAALEPVERTALALLSGSAATLLLLAFSDADVTGAATALPLVVGALFGWGSRITFPQAVEALGTETALGRLAGLPLPPLQPVAGTDVAPVPDGEPEQAVRASLRLPAIDLVPLLAKLPPLEPRPWPASSTSPQNAQVTLEEVSLVGLSGVDPLAVLLDFEAAATEVAG